MTTTAKISTLAVVLTMATGNLFGQQTGSVWVKIPSAQELSIGMVNGRLNTSSQKVNALIAAHNVQSIEQAFPASRNAALLDVYEVTCACDENDLLQAVAAEHGIFVSPEIGPRYEALFTPNDFYLSVPNDYALTLIKAQDAWNFTTGSSSVVIGITDTNFDPQHEELQGKYTYMTSGLTNSNIAHGTSVAITAGGATDNSLGKSSIGYNTQMQLRGMTYNEILAASYSGAKVINASWVSGCSFSQYAQDVITEAYNNGSVVVASAGNGTTCGGASNLVYPAAYTHVIAVTSVGPQDNHERFPGNPSITHQHNAAVDICAPGYDVAISGASGSYVSGTGSSYAAAYVSGTAALILSVNPCLTPANVEYILKASADNIDMLNANYAGTLGAGRLNASAAIQLALSFSTLEVGSTVVRSCETTDQTIVLNGLSGDAPYIATWSTGATGMDLTTAAAGVYNYAVTDANGCIANGSVTVEEVTLLSHNADLTHVLCYGASNGSIDLTVNGGVAPYAYSWDNGALTEDLDGLAAGSYRVDVTDASGCTFSASFDITAPAAIELTAAGIDPTLSSTGSIDLTVNGGTGAYTFNWSNGEQNEDLSNLNGGVYTVEVADANGCSASTSVELEFATIGNFDGTTADGETDSDTEASSAAGIEEVSAEVELTVYPNPATDYVNVVNNSDEAVTIVLMDGQGKVVFETEQLNGTQQITLNGMANGTYFIKGFTAAGEVFAKQLIKM